MATIILDGLSKSEQRSIVQHLSNLHGFTHFTQRATGKLEAYGVEPCERCGVDAMNPNSIGFMGVGKDVLMEMGLKELGEFPPECDVTGDGEYCCSECNRNMN